MSMREFARRFGIACCVSALLLSACAMGGDPPTTRSTREARAMQQRFIVRYVPGSAPERDSAVVAERVEATVRGAGIVDAEGAPRGVIWLRRLAVGADLVAIEPALEAAQAQRLLDALKAEADVQYAEPDARMTIGPGPEMRVRGKPAD